MRKSPILFLGLMTSAIAFGWGCGDEGGGTGGAGGGQGQPCEREEDCESTECRFGFCISGVCEFQVASDGPAEGVEQVADDCMSFNCKDGELIEEYAAGDTADDPDNSDCMVPVCVNMDGVGVNDFEPDEVGDGCDSGNGDGVCDAEGVCSCAILPDGPAFVDPVNGQDIASNGGASGACAFQTIEYALTQATGEIRLPLADFTVANTLTLTGAQYLNCSVNQDNNNERTTLTGSGTAPVIVLDGMANGFEDCLVDGQGAASAVVVSSVAMGIGHTIDDAIIQNAVDGITVTGGNVDVDNNVIQNNSGVGLNFTALDANGNLENNDFMGNGTDVSCADESMSVVGENNNFASCVTCVNCMDF